MLAISVTPVPLPYEGLALFPATLVKSAIVAGIAWRYLGVLQAGSDLRRIHLLRGWVNRVGIGYDPRLLELSPQSRGLHAPPGALQGIPLQQDHHLLLLRILSVAQDAPPAPHCALSAPRVCGDQCPLQRS